MSHFNYTNHSGHFFGQTVLSEYVRELLSQGTAVIWAASYRQARDVAQVGVGF